MIFSADKLRFEKVSIEEWERAVDDIVGPEHKDAHIEKTRVDLKSVLMKHYEDIKLPTRATTGSVGYDFYTPIDLTIFPGSCVMIPTGIRVYMADDVDLFLMITPKSGLGVKYKTQLSNTVGIIDKDYYYAKNEGHILISMSNGLDYEGCPMKRINDILTGNPKLVIDQDAKETQRRILSLPTGKAFVQGIFLPMCVMDDNVTNIRVGGFGSTADNQPK